MESFKLQNEAISFRCENCQEVINNSSNVCRFCRFEISGDELKIKSETQTKVNQAYNDANNLKFLGIACLAISIPRSIDDVLFGYFTNSYVNYFPHGLILIFLFFWIRWQFGALPQKSSFPQTFEAILNTFEASGQISFQKSGLMPNS